jgi:hypothetical protein
MSDDKILIKLQELLTSSPKSARDFMRALKSDGSMSEDGKKKAVNSALYKLLKDKKVVKTDSTPPMWFVPKVEKTPPSSGDESSEELLTLIFIDISNSPCHTEALKYVGSTVKFYLYANPTYSGHIPNDDANISTTIVPEDTLISTELIVRATTSACAAKAVNRSARILIVSTANALNGLDRMLTITNSDLDVEIIKNGWEGLKLHLE